MTGHDGVSTALVHDASVYDVEFKLDDENDSHALVVRMVGERKRVLELGCATGATTRVLQAHGCQVVGVELDPEAARRAEPYAETVVVADLDLVDISAALADDSFDVIVAADILEHLRNPKRTLGQCLPLLRPGGEVIVSIPNVAHADVRLALLNGRFQYQPWGVLDETHLRFFTRASLEEFLDECGLVPLTWDRTHRDVGATEVAGPEANQSLLAWVRDQPDADTYQFVVRCAIGPQDSHLRELAARLDAAMQEAAERRVMESELARVNAALTTTTTKLDEARAELARASADHVAERERLHAAVNEVGERMRVEHELEMERLRAAARAAEQRAANLAAVADELRSLERIAGRGGSEVVRLEGELRRAGDERQRLADQLAHAARERDDYKSGFESLANVHEELVALQRSESLRLGRAMLSPIATMRRVVRAWRRAARP